MKYAIVLTLWLGNHPATAEVTWGYDSLGACVDDLIHRIRPNLAPLVPSRHKLTCQPARIVPNDGDETN